MIEHRIEDGPGAHHPTRHARGKLGRRPKLSIEQQATITDEVLSGRCTAAQMARRYRVSEPTVSRILAGRRVAAEAVRGGDAADGSEGGQPGAEAVLGVLPMRVLDERLAIVGTSGSGKTYAAKGLVERLLDGGARVCIADPLGVWWGLRVEADGCTPAPHGVVVFGGQHADVPLTPGLGTALGHLVGTHSFACVVDVSDLGSGAEQRVFMTAFTEALYDSNTGPLHLVLDEADLWAPQRVQGDGYDLLGRVEAIVRRGRVRGFVPWLITQRPAVLHKDVLSQADILLSMKLTASQDRAAVGRWIEGQADRAASQRILAALPRMARGEGWVWAPADGVLARVAVPRIRSFDSSGTPRREQRNGTPDPRLPVDLVAIRAALSGGATEGAEAGSGGSLRQVLELERRLRQREDELASALARVAQLEIALQVKRTGAE